MAGEGVGRGIESFCFPSNTNVRFKRHIKISNAKGATHVEQCHKEYRCADQMRIRTGWSEPLFSRNINIIGWRSNVPLYFAASSISADLIRIGAGWSLTCEEYFYFLYNNKPQQQAYANNKHADGGTSWTSSEFFSLSISCSYTRTLKRMRPKTKAHIRHASAHGTDWAKSQPSFYSQMNNNNSPTLLPWSVRIHFCGC